MSLLAFALCVSPVLAAEYEVLQISKDSMNSTDPVISETGLAAWSAYTVNTLGTIISEIMIYRDEETRPLLRAMPDGNPSNIKPIVQSNTLIWVATLGGVAKNGSWVLREVPSAERDEPYPELPATYALKIAPDGSQTWSIPPTNEPVASESAMPVSAVTNGVDAGAVPAAATGTNGVPAAAAAEPKPEPAPSPFIEPAPDTSGPTNEARRTPSGATEIMRWTGGADIERITRDNRDDLGPSTWGDTIAWQKAKGWPFGWEIMVLADGHRMQMTTNYYYDMAPKVHGRQVVWYGWDGHDFEIFLYDHDVGTTIQITSNQYDDVSPEIWDGAITWEGYAGVDGDVFLYRNGEIRKISENIEDDLSPRIWNGKVVWQGFDGDDFEIYLFDGDKTIKLTSNTYDDLNPDIRDGVICWMGYYGNWDSEIFAWDGSPDVIRLTDNDDEDRDPKTAGGRVIWKTNRDDLSLIFLAQPK